MERKAILQNTVEELKLLASKAGKTLDDRMLKNLFMKKKAYQKDWPQEILRKKATLLAGSTILAMGELSEIEIKASLK
jgi:hypothetical protein